MSATVLTGTNITRYQYSAILMGLNLQVKTGLKSTGNRVPNAARLLLTQAGISPARTVKKLAQQFAALKEAKFKELDQVDATANVTPVN